MIINLGDAPFKAFIKVTYPKGTCTCTLGSTTYSHSGGGTATFEVNKKGTWTITAAYNSISKSTTASVSTRGETKTVSLSYTTYLYKLGDECKSVSGGWVTAAKKFASDSNTNAANIVCNRNSDNIYFTNKGATGAILYAKNKISLKDIKTIKFKGTFGYTDDQYYVRFCIWSSFGSTTMDNLVVVRDGWKGLGDFSIDVSSLTGSYYIGFAVYGWENSSVTMKQLYLEV